MRFSTWFLVLTALFVTTLITANITAVKLVSVGPLTFPGAIVVFPVSYILGDVLTEVYGYGRARLVIWLGFFSNLMAIIAFALVRILPAAPFWEHQAAYDVILGSTARILAASFLAYLIGEFSNSFLLAKLKIATRGRWLWIRTISSTIVGEGLDTAVFVTLAFAGKIPGAALGNTVVTAWLLKTTYEVLATPLTYGVVAFLKKQEGMDVYDYSTNFNPLKLGSSGQQG